MNQVTDDGRRQGFAGVQEATGESLFGALEDEDRYGTEEQPDHGQGHQGREQAG